MALARWLDDDNAALFTDLYQLSMLQAYHRLQMDREAVFDLFVRRLRKRNYLVACGLDTVLHYLETLRFTPEAIEYLASLDRFDTAFLDWLADFRFTGDVFAVPEGTPVFANEPILQVVAPIGQAQLVETFLLNQITFQTGVASKAARVVRAAAGRQVVDFGMRRMHGADAGLKAARAAYIAGVEATSNVLAGQLYGIPVSGTMAHAYVQAHESEEEALRAFARIYPGTTVLVDTYDTLEGVRKVIDLVRDPDRPVRIGAVRLDSGDLGSLARETRRMFDEAGLSDIRIFASGSLDEFGVRDLVAGGAPIDGFGVGTRMGTIEDQPALDSVYKLVRYGGEGRMKLSAEKSNLPGCKQVYRQYREGRPVADVIATEHERPEGERLLQLVMDDGRRTDAGRVSLEAIRRHARESLDHLPEHLHALEPVEPGYRVELSAGQKERTEQLREELWEQVQRG